MEWSSLTLDTSRIVPDFGALGANLCAPFEVRELKRARIVWLDEGCRSSESLSSKLQCS
jgi:hypothetical protein